MPDPTVPFSLRLTPAEYRVLAEKAEAAGMTRSGFVRRIITAPPVTSEPVREKRAA